MSNIVNLVSKLKVSQNSTIQFNEQTDWPANPSEGQIEFKGQILYIYATINNISTWFPLTTVRDVHIHSQGGAAQTWTVQHNFGTQNTIFMVYDSSDTVMVVNRENVTDNSFTLPFTEAETGKCVVFHAKEVDTPFKIGEMFKRTTTGNDIIIKGNLLPSVDDTWSLGANGYRWNDMHLDGATMYVGDTVVINSTGITVDPPASPTQASEQPKMGSSKLSMQQYSYNAGADTINPSITYDAPMTVGAGNWSEYMNAGTNDFIVNAANFSIGPSGFSFNGTLSITEFDGGVW